MFMLKKCQGFSFLGILITCLIIAILVAAGGSFFKKTTAHVQETVQEVSKAAQWKEQFNQQQAARIEYFNNFTDKSLQQNPNQLVPKKTNPRQNRQKQMNLIQ